jgi:hypothetical protein
LIESMKRNRLIKENTISDVLNSLCFYQPMFCFLLPLWPA